jgi:pimeloyl-ACP methyl ester carboxylesterase
VYALDLPGAGGSDPAPGVASVDAAVNVASDFLDSMRIRTFDLIARGNAAAAALRLLEQRAGAARRVLLVGAPGPVRGAGITVLAEADATPARLMALLAHTA